MSNVEKPEFRALRDLEAVAARVSEELSAFRLRAQRAEAAQAEIAADHDMVGTRARMIKLEAENRDLRTRVDHAKDRVADLLARLRFLEEQMATHEIAR